MIILTGKRNATVKFCHVLHVAHKHELHKLTMPNQNWSQASGLFKFFDSVYQAGRSLPKIQCVQFCNVVMHVCIKFKKREHFHIA